MKNFFRVAAFMLLGSMFAGSTLYAQVKEKKISYTKFAYYQGPAEKKSPKGQGQLVINEDGSNKMTLEGTFDGNYVPDAVFTFAVEGLTFKGKVSFKKTVDMSLLVPISVMNFELSDGAFFLNEKCVGALKEPFAIKMENLAGEGVFMADGQLYLLDKKYDRIVAVSKDFAGCSEYEIENPAVVNFRIQESKFSLGKLQESSNPPVLLFANGAKTPLTYRGADWTCPNGDYVKFDNTGHAQELRLTSSEGEIYEGSVACDEISELIDFKTSKRDWNQFKVYTVEGIHTGADGNKETIRFGMLEQEYTKKQQEYTEKYNQSKSLDHYKFDAKGELAAFRMTYLDLAVHEYMTENGKVIRNMITYPDGTIVSLEKKKITSDEYKEYKAMSSAPHYLKYKALSSAPHYLSLDLRGTRTYKDGLTIDLWLTKNKENNQTFYRGFLGIREEKTNGDYIELENDYDGRLLNKNNNKVHNYNMKITAIQKTFPDYTVIMEDYHHSRVEYKNGNLYSGYFDCIAEGNSPLINDRRLAALQLDTLTTFDNIVGVKFREGVVCDPKGKIIEIYRNGSKLDEFDFERERIQLQAERDRELERIKKEKEEKIAAEKLYKELVKIHGEKNLESALRGEIKVGMHEDLFAIAVKARGWKFELDRAGKDYTVCRVHGVTYHDYGSKASFKDGTIAYVTLSGKKVTHINWYGNTRVY